MALPGTLVSLVVPHVGPVVAFVVLVVPLVGLVVPTVGLVAALFGFEFAGRLRSRLGIDTDSLAAHAWKWLVPAVVVAYVLVVERQSLASIGWRIDGPLSFVLQSMAGTVLLLGSNALVEPVLSRFGLGGGDIEAGLASFADYAVPERLFVAATAGVTEEVPYRGYAIERVASLTGSPLLGGAVSLVAFVAVHVGDTWTPRAALRMLVPAGVIVAVYLWTRSLPVVITIHAFNDAVGLLLADRYADGEAAHG